MKRIIPLFVIGALLLSACGVLQPAPAEPTPSDEIIATRVSQILTTMPTATAAAEQPSITPPPTGTAEPATEEPQPTATLIPTEAPTAEVAATQAGDAGGGAPEATDDGSGAGGGGPTTDSTADAGGGGPSTTGTPDAGGGGPATTGTPDAGGGGPALIPTPVPTISPTPVADAGGGGPNIPTPPPTVSPVQIGTPVPDAGGGGPTPPPTLTVPASDMRNRLGNPAFTDPMDNGNNWPTGVDVQGFTSIAFNEGQMQLTSLKTTSGWRMSTYGAELRDFYIEARVTPGQCTGNDRYGIFFRVPERTKPEQGYWYGFTCDGRYALQKWDGKAEPDGVVSNLIYWKKSTALNAGPNATNMMGVMAIGSRIYLYANGQLIDVDEDNTWLKGAFGMFVGGRETPNFTIKVDEISVWTNPVAP